METTVSPVLAGCLVEAIARAAKAEPLAAWPEETATEGAAVFRSAGVLLRLLHRRLTAELEAGSETRSFLARWSPVLDHLERDLPSIAAALDAAPASRTFVADLRPVLEEGKALRAFLSEAVSVGRAALAKPIDMEAVRAAEERMKAGHFVTHEQLEKELLGK